MDQNNQPSQPTPPVTAQPAAPAEVSSPAPTQTPSQAPQQPPVPSQSPKKQNSMVFIIVAVCVLLIGALIAYMFFFSSKKPVLTQQTPSQMVQQTQTSPTPAISQTVQDEVNSIDVNQDNSDIQDVQKDVNSL